MFKLESEAKLNIKVVGIGGAGNNIVNLLAEKEILEIELINVNTDSQVLKASPVALKIQLGIHTTKGEGTGGDIEEARRSVEEQKEEIIEVIKDAHLLFLIAGLGGGTGTGATPPIAEIAGHLRKMTIGIVTLPFYFEGKSKRSKAMAGKKELKEKVDTLITIENDRLFKSFTELNSSLRESFGGVNQFLGEIVETLSSLLIHPGIVNLDMAAFRKVLGGSKDIVLSIGEGKGDDRVSSCVESALTSPWLEGHSFKGLRRVLVNVMGGEDLTLNEAARVVEMVKRRVHSEAYITFAVLTLPKYKGKLKAIIMGDPTPVEESELMGTPIERRRRGFLLLREQ